MSEAAQAWQDWANRSAARFFLPPFSPEIAEQFSEQVRQWEAVSEREDCPEWEAARGMAAGWWAELARLLIPEAEAGTAPVW